ncbi:magnesium-translocating P-type ATPase [Labrys okinawensis]|uniref:Magnesium-transporting ATPase, P-type 1 n=1 Tax=Labrys okinawensis TaxID=346911 RepID=A0A2S9Q632_9HYPH|nr:magnesium-translocating P-type ATPase [Labrys okinawensis]PRH84806.1 magnesium-translocating P-type ATPase [Labrys okinawensis]
MTSTAPSQLSQGEAAAFWTHSPKDWLDTLDCGNQGLTSGEAEKRLARFGLNADRKGQHETALHAILRRLLEPLSLILFGAGLVSIATGDAIGGAIIVAILVLSIGLDTFQEGHATRAAEALRRSVALKAEVKRDGSFKQVAVENVVPGDLVRIRAGDVIPADALIVESTAFTAAEAALTGEPYPVAKSPGTVRSANPADASNAVFRGAVAQTGEAIALVIATGRATIFGTAASMLGEASAPSPFQRDLREFGLVIARLTLALVVLVLAARVMFGRPPLDSLLFAVALAVGLTPELLPMITTVTLSRGAIRLARRRVIVKRLAAIHDLGAMTVLCTDKTGTLTSAQITLAKSIDVHGLQTGRPAGLAAVAADLGGDRGSLDAALIAAEQEPSHSWALLGRRPFDYTRRLGSVLAKGPDGPMLIVKGAPEAVLGLCSHMKDGAQILPLTAEERTKALEILHGMAQEGLRSIAVATRPWPEQGQEITEKDEQSLTLEGFCAFADPPKPTAGPAIAHLAKIGVKLKILSGDDPLVVRRLAGLVGLDGRTVLSGSDIAKLDEDALAVHVRSVDAFSRLTPDQKSRIIKALQKSQAVVGYLGDGINDAPALKVADIGLSVEGATGVAQAAADMILLASDLEVVAAGVEEGRRTFANILKYVRMGASSNFGNMLSMALASILLPFLPMLPTQILLNNLLYDLSEIGIPFDQVRREAIAEPQVWDMGGLLRFAAIMGPVSSLFDFLTFAVLLAIFHVAPDEFRTTWFLESMATQISVIFLIRTAGRPWRNRPSPMLVASSLFALLVALVVPFTPLGPWFGFVAPPPGLLLAMAGIVILYLVCVELLKPLAIGRPPKPGIHRDPVPAAARKVQRSFPR